MRERVLIFLSPYDHRNVLSWSGTLRFLSETLEKNDAGIKMHYLNGGWLNILAMQLNRVLWHIGFKHNICISSYYAICSGLYISARLLFMPEGPIIAVSASNYVPYLMTKRSIIYVTDAPLRAAAEMYQNFKELPKWLIRQCDNNEARTLRRAKSVIVPSKWAFESATTDYGVKPERVFKIPFGANISDEYIARYYAPKSTIGETLNLIFVSADWKRKGGEKAIAICRALIHRGISVRFVVIGDAPDYVKKLDFVDVRGFLNKSDNEQLTNICRAYREAHFLLLPTQADASPIVFSESQAFGVPPVTHIVGGTASAVNHGETGLLLPLDASPDRFAEELLCYVHDPSCYEKISGKCRKWYLENAQWSNWRKLILKLTEMDEPHGPDT
jgi:glycosyltransferase involved in cell wall biosynthesis